jgi:hypothetical protein
MVVLNIRSKDTYFLIKNIPSPLLLFNSGVPQKRYSSCKDNSLKRAAFLRLDFLSLFYRQKKVKESFDCLSHSFVLNFEYLSKQYKRTQSSSFFLLEISTYANFYSSTAIMNIIKRKNTIFNKRRYFQI